MICDVSLHGGVVTVSCMSHGETAFGGGALADRL